MTVTLVTMNKKKKEKAVKGDPLFHPKLNKRVFVQNTLTVNLHKLNARDLKLNARNLKLKRTHPTMSLVVHRWGPIIYLPTNCTYSSVLDREIKNEIKYSRSKLNRRLRSS